MSDNQSHEARYRDDAIEVIEEAPMSRGVEVEAYAKATGVCALDGQWDGDGDCIVAQATTLFWDPASGVLRTAFPHGIDPRHAARLLRKIADMLEGPSGAEIANLGDRPGDYNMAYRLSDGDVLVFNLRDELDRMRNERAGEDGEPRDA